MSANPFAHLSRELLSVAVAKVLPPKPVFSAEELSHFGDWVALTGMKPEGARQFDLSKYPYQTELYNETRKHPRARVVIMKAAQTGLTVKLLNRAMWLCSDVRKQVNVGLGFPSRDAVEQLAASRFRPQLYTSARMIELIRDVNRVDLMRLGVSNMRFLGLRSGITNDSNPLDAELIDEVRLIASTTVERFMIRTSESTLIDEETGARGLIELNSTAGFPAQDIHRYFLDSTQGWWATPCSDVKCRRNRSGIMLAREFAENLGRVIGQEDSGRYYLRCPRCGARITDDMQAQGFYIHENPGAQWTGYQFSQLVKGEDFLNNDIMPAWNRAINLPEFHNSRLGLPYMDSEAVPASRTVVEACADETGDYHWPREPLGRDGRYRALGVDQRAPEKHCVIKSLDGNGNERLEHVCVLEASGEEAAAQIVRLARAWGVSILVMDGEPSYDLFIMVARALPKRMVWQSDYVDGQAETIRWADKHSDKQQKKASGETKYEYRVLVDRYKGLDWSLGLFARRKVVLPAMNDLYALRTPRQMAGVQQFHSAAEEFVTHLGNLARYKAEKRVKLGNGESIHVPGEYILRWRYLNLDPHYAHANLSASVGLARRHSTGSIIGIEESGPVSQTGPEANLPPSARPSVLMEEAERKLANTCGSCRHFKLQGGAGLCGHPDAIGRIQVGETDPGCDEHRPIKNQ